ncbi:MAG: tRNA adenosine(34) deaminase TadA [Anaerovoracaceae bacterium]
MEKEQEKQYMQIALTEAEKAFAKSEVPVGAIIIKDGNIIAKAHNQVETLKDPTAHAEILAIQKAAGILGNQRLAGCEMFVTVEPCAMCAGAIILARIEAIYIGTFDPKTGACGSVNNLLSDQRLNHQVKIHTKLLENECRELIKNFFAELRENKNRKIL